MTANSTPPVIRDAREGDIPSVTAIESSSLGLWKGKEDLFFSELKAPSATFLVALEGDSVIGFIVAHKILDEVEINSIAVDPAHRRKGVGASLVHTIIDRLCNEPGVKMYLEVGARNRAALGFYRSLSFRETGYRKGYYSGDDAILMVRSNEN
jgi:ribosomal-protein-alanine N-acetyltransferase